MFRDRGSSNARLNKSDHDYQFIFSSIIEKILEDSWKLKVLLYSSKSQKCAFDRIRWELEVRGTLVDKKITTTAVGALLNRGTQREYSSKPLKHGIVERILVFKR